MRPAPSLGLASGIVAALVLLTGAPVPGQITLPPDFVMKKGENSPAPVTFSHAKHKATVEKCTTCHARAFKLKRDQSGPITLEALQQGKFCETCHDGKTRVAGRAVFSIDSCDRCHGS
ncbi:MAG: hypothetical protein HYV62_03210 [Candidatus Rokubacteria bacterium]|nr:hypothetical protein [Candidatus Rokubacteria bacterium]